MPAAIVAIINQKGGVGKTTTAVNLSAYLAILGRRTLLIDADPQGNATSGLGVSRKLTRGTFHGFLLGGEPLSASRLPTQVPDLDILPANEDSLTAGRELAATPGGQARLRDRLAAELPAHRYDFVIIDCPPNLEAVVINAMACAHGLIVPTRPDYFSLEGLADLMETYGRAKAALNPALAIWGVLITMADRTNLSAEAARDIRGHLGPLVFQTAIPRNIKLAEAPSHCLPIALYAPRCAGSAAYKALAMEILGRARP